MRKYKSIDIFKLICAFFVIAIHTAPFVSINDTLEFIFSGVIFRVAVPFFLMCTGFFLFNGDVYFSNTKVYKFIKKIALIYLVSMILYIPLNIYNDYFTGENLLFNIIKDVAFDGTIYHLWYLPAVILGVLIVKFLLSKFNIYTALAITIALYMVGLFGDSYYGLIEGTKNLSGLYENLFYIFDYTRNGLFLAPIFILMGNIIKGMTIKLNNRKKFNTVKNSNIIYFLVSVCLLITEGLVLNFFAIQKHDSMYVFLIPTMFFLFNIIININPYIKKQIKHKDLSLLIYLIHPMIIVFVRFIAKGIKLDKIIIDNSLIFFLCVSIASYFSSLLLIKAYRNIADYFKESKIIKNAYVYPKRAYSEINFDNLTFNIDSIQSVLQNGTNILAIVKADGYGHNCALIARHLNSIGINCFGVATLEEAIKLRKEGIFGDILILSYTQPSKIKLIKKYDLTQSLISYEYAIMLNRQHIQIKTHLKIDTGMHRLGFDFNQPKKILKMFSSKYLLIDGIYTHLATSSSLDDEDVAFANYQIDNFNRVLNIIKSNNIPLPKTHVQSSYGCLNYPELEYDYVRIGITMYGCFSSQQETKINIPLKPILSIKSHIILLREIEKGDCVSYDRNFTAKRDTLMAVVPIGYADGVPKAIENTQFNVMVNDILVPIIGNICMDHLMIDVTDVSDVKLFDTVTILNDLVSCLDYVNGYDSISNEFFSRLGERIK